MDSQYTELLFTVDVRSARQSEELLSGLSDAGLYVEDYSDMERMLPLVGAADYVDAELAAKSRDTACIHLYIPVAAQPERVLGEAAALLERAGIAFRCSSAALPETDWENEWKKQHKPHRVGKRLLLCPTWERVQPQQGELVLKIDPRGAFGSGEDTTTTLCLQLLEQQLSPGDRVLDMGCGSGVLSVAALLLGAKSALGVDIDERVLTEAPETAAQNGVGGRFSVLCGNVLCNEGLTAQIGGDYELVCGNMVADVQLKMLPFYARTLKTGGRLVLSGILFDRERELKKALSASGLTLIGSLSDGDWRALACRK